jgi:orotate phosphoribosyltransferase
MWEHMTLTRDEVFAIFRATGTLREGHFRLTSGRHSKQFFLMPHIFQHPLHTERLCAALAEKFRDVAIDTVVGPATGGIVLAYEMARQIGRLTNGTGPRAIFTEKTAEGGMALKRQWSLEPGEKVLVVEDAVTTGGSIFKLLDAIRPYQPVVAGIGCIADRSGGTVRFGVPFRSLVTLQVESWTAEQCPLCKEGIELVKPKG